MPIAGPGIGQERDRLFLPLPQIARRRKAFHHVAVLFQQGVIKILPRQTAADGLADQGGDYCAGRLAAGSVLSGNQGRAEGSY